MVRVAIIGGGLAGTACAYALKRAGAEPVIYEAGPALAHGASGNDLGTYNPRFSSERNAQSDYFTSAFSLALATFSSLCHSDRPEGAEEPCDTHLDRRSLGFARDDNKGNVIDWDPCGALHLITDEKKEKRYPKTLLSWGWDLDHMHLVDAAEASGIANVELKHDALYLPDAGFVSPRKLCEVYAQGIEIKYNHAVEDVTELDEDIVILANSTSVKKFKEAEFLPINSVRGQMTEVNETLVSRNLMCNLHYGGYIGKARGGVHMLGATFQPWLDHTRVLLEDNVDNIDKLGEFVPVLKGKYEVVGNRAALRASSSDHFPIVGALEGHDNLYVSTAHGSHGVISTIMAAELLTDMILHRPHCLPMDTIKALSPSRFL